MSSQWLKPKRRSMRSALTAMSRASLEEKAGVIKMISLLYARASFALANASCSENSAMKGCTESRLQNLHALCLLSIWRCEQAMPIDAGMRDASSAAGRLTS